MIAPLIDHNLSVPKPLEILKFAFEVAPDKMFELAGGSIPFGCHAWEHYGKVFWFEASLSTS
jgi:hypothetical protein